MNRWIFMRIIYLFMPYKFTSLTPCF
jgi:hypothetical protein